MFSSGAFRIQLGLSLYAVLSLGSMATMSIGAGLFALLWLSVRPWESYRFTPELKTYSKISALFWILALLSLFCAWLWPMGYRGEFIQVRLPEDIAKAWYFLLPFGLADAWTRLSTAAQKQVLRVWLGALLVLSCIGIQQFWTGWPRMQHIPTHLGHYHATLFLGHHLSTASIWIFPVFAALGWSLRFSKADRWVRLAVVLGIAVLILSFARSVWMALPVGLILMIVLQLRSKVRALVLVGSFLIFLAAAQHPVVKTRMLHSLGTQERFELWEANLEFFKERPILGVGLFKNSALSTPYLQQKLNGENVFSGHAHNNFLHMLAGVGALGALAWLVWCFFMGHWLWRARSHPEFGPMFLGLFCAWIVFQINGLTQVNFWEGKVMHQFFFVLGLVLGIPRSNGKETTRTR